ncbi:GlsB/YeaQ/YmgE family stress response membrane protein [Saccharopolyspora thermophila]|nr:GlsB/YeaQ/YmgE family stress response membrane protein [Saccharopolyspora subtropica]
MGILSWILFGLIAGAIAKFILPGRDPGGIFVTMLIGIAGGLLGGWLGSTLMGAEGVTGFNVMSFVWAIIGSLILLGIYRLVFHGRHRSHA